MHAGEEFMAAEEGSYPKGNQTYPYQHHQSLIVRNFPLTSTRLYFQKMYSGEILVSSFALYRVGHDIANLRFVDFDFDVPLPARFC